MSFAGLLRSTSYIDFVRLCKITDLSGTSNFALLALLTLVPLKERHVPTVCLVASLFQIAWALRLGSLLFYRVLKTGRDHRFDDMRSKFWPFAGFWFLQLLWVWLCSMPVILINSPSVNAQLRAAQYTFGHPVEVAGAVLFAIGFTLEAIADVQKYRFRQSCQRGDM